MNQSDNPRPHKQKTTRPFGLTACHIPENPEQESSQQ